MKTEFLCVDFANGLEIRKLVMARVEKAEMFYLKQLNEKSRHNYVDSSRLQKLGEKCETEATAHFQKISADFSQDLRDEYESVLTANFRRRFAAFSNENEGKKKRLKSELKEASFQAENTYAEKMNAAISSSAVNIDTAHDRALLSAMKHINQVEVGLGDELREEVVFDFYSTIRKRKDEYVRSSKETSNAKIEEARKSSLESYKQTMSEKADSGYLDDSKLTQAHEVALKSVLNKLTELRLGPTTDRVFATAKADTVGLRQEYQRLSLTKAIASFKKRKDIAFAAYKQNMKRAPLGNLDSDEFKILHDLCRLAAIKIFEESGPTDPRSEFDKVGQLLLNEMQEFCRQLLQDHVAEQVTLQILRRLFL